MTFLYRFETSERVRSVKMTQTSSSVPEVVDAILKSIFKDKEPSCSLELLESTTETLRANNSKPYVFRRTYLNKFKPSCIPTVVVPKKKKRRWRSPPKKRKRWTSPNRENGKR